MSHSKECAAHQEFLKYKPYIIGCMLEKFGKSYDNVESLRDRWFHLYAYSQDIEKFLILKSQDYLYTRVSTRDLKFLRALVKYMADYLSEYTMRKVQTEDKDIRRATRKEQKKILFDEIYAKCHYIQHLVFKQDKKNIFNVEKPSKTNKKRPRIQKAKHDYEVHRQVAREFADVNEFRKKR